jgi:hypothetical protein
VPRGKQCALLDFNLYDWRKNISKNVINSMEHSPSSGKLTDPQESKNSAHIMEPDSSLPHSQAQQNNVNHMLHTLHIYP